jgi:hypothetical protein
MPASVDDVLMHRLDSGHSPVVQRYVRGRWIQGSGEPISPPEVWMSK